MQLLLIRHAVAEEREEFRAGGLGDDLRPLSAEGQRKMERGAAGLAGLLPGLDLLATSPLVRARQTAEIVAAAFGGVAIVETPTLAPGAHPDRFLAWLADGRVDGVVAGVGHQPHFGRLAGRLLRFDDCLVVEFKKGSAALFEVEPKAGAGGAAMLLWSLAPAQLHRLEE